MIKNTHATITANTNTTTTDIKYETFCLNHDNIFTFTN